MQLFQLAKEQLRHIDRLVGKMRQHANGSRVLHNLGLPLLQFDFDGDTALLPGEPHSFDGINLEVAHDDDGQIDYTRVEEGIKDFTNSVLFFAFNPLKRGAQETEGGHPVTISEMRNEPRDGIFFRNLDLDHFTVRAADESTDTIEKLMFKGWKSNPSAKHKLTKTFSSPDERERVEHLFCCMAQAFGFSKEDVDHAFYKNGDDRRIMVHREFLTQLAKVEQSMEADFGERKA